MEDQIPRHLTDVESGWRELLQELHQRALDIDPWYTCAQVKEKFGVLRVYMDPSQRDFGTLEYAERGVVLYKAACETEERSESVCEYCGAPGRCRALSTRWLKTLCDGCAPESSIVTEAPRRIRPGKPATLPEV